MAGLEDATQVFYVSPHKALSNDIHRNLQIALAPATEAFPVARVQAECDWKGRR